MDFFARVAIAVAMVEDHMAHQGYFETEQEQDTFRVTHAVFDHARRKHRHLLPSHDLDGWPSEW